MFDFEIQRSSRRCAKTDREFAPGEPFISVLVSDGAQIVRHDYAREAWDQPPANAIGWWQCHMPEPNAKRAHWAPNDVLLHYFEQLAGDEAQADVRYVLALLMIRRRIVRLEDTQRDEQGREALVLFCPKNETEYQVTVREPTGGRVREIQDELTRLLFADAV